MDKKIKTLGVSLLSAFTLMAAPNVVSAETADEVTDDFSLTIFHTNDMHAGIDNFGKMSYFLNEQRALLDNSLYFDAGDAFSGNPVVDLMDGIPMIELLNAMELDLFTVGNHEFDYGQEAFEARRNESNFPWLSANMDASGSDIISGADAYKIFEFEEENVKVGVIGLTQAPPATAPSGLVGLQFNPYYETVQKYAHLRDEVDILIGLNHIGQADDTRLAEQTEMFDLIIGGHSHTAIDTPIVVNGTPIAQSGSNGRNVGILDLKLDLSTKKVSVEGKLQSVRDLEDDNVDPVVQGMLDKYKTETDEKLSKVIGKTNTGLNRDNRRKEDSALGNMITDALRHATGADIAITNNGGIRASIEPGDITLRDIFTVDPFGNIVSTVEMKGHDLKDMIAYSYHRSLADYGPQIDLQSSGLHYTIYTDKDGLYVDSDLFIDGAPMDLDKTYTITTNNFMVEGGDGYDFSKATIIGQNQMQVTEALIAYIEEQGTLDYEMTEGRILTKPYEAEEPATRTGWIKAGSDWYYYDAKGVMQTGWVKAKGTWYYLADNGVMQTGWNKVDNTWYYMSGSGAMQTGWVKSNNTWYYMTGSGAMRKGWQQVNGTWYYMSNNGAMQTGWNKVGNTWYYMTDSGAMQTGWNKVGPTWYYMSNSGAMQTGWIKSNNNWYYLNNDGSMDVGNITINGIWYKFSPSGKLV